MDWTDPRLYPEELAKAERQLVQKRRTQPDLDKDLDKDRRGKPGVGFALSGGGIRSATFCLGVFQALARRGLLAKVDFLSTVSGGGYLGSFLGALFNPDRKDVRAALRKDLKLDAGTDDVRTIEAALDGHESAIVRWLRENGRYLSPVGAGDALLAAAIYLRNLVALHVVLGVALLGVFLAGGAFRPVFDFLKISEIAPPPFAGGTIWWSPWIWVAVVPLLLVAVPAGWAYWLTQRGVGGRRNYWTLVTTVVIALACLVPEIGWIPAIDTSLGWPSTIPRLIVSGAAVLAVAFWLVDDRLASRTADREEKAGRLATEGKLEYRLLLVRNRLSKWTKLGVMAAAALLGFALVDSIAQSLYVEILAQGLRGFLGHVWTWPPIAAILTLLGAAQRLAAKIPGRERLHVPGQVIAWVAALVVGTTVLTVWAAIAHAFAWGGHWPCPEPLFWKRAATGALVAGVLSWVIGQTMQFVNNSSQHAMYAARLTRAYLGASNQSRWTAQGSRMSDVLPGDAIPMHAYRPFDCGGPLHLINVTLNETVGGRYPTEYRDRKGMDMAIGPAGVSIGASHHAVWKWSEKTAKGQGPPLEVCATPGSGFHPLFGDDRRQHVVENRQLGHWVAISGAAFTTGLGARTSLPLGILLGLANVRLGYWWDSQVKRSYGGLRGWLPQLFDRIFPVQTSLLDELLGRYWGPAKQYWYLSDGGHFENTACYELIRRRLPLIVCCDCGADANYTWDDLGGLVLKARIDFNAEIRFLEGSELTQWVPTDRSGNVCAPSSICRTTLQAERKDSAKPCPSPTWSRAHATVGLVYYLDSDQKRQDFDAGTATPDSVLLVIKPSLTGDEPADVMEYFRSHPSFPQEATFDQYFDEAQWESYRKLGEHIGAQLFRAGESWSPVFLARRDPPDERTAG
jgi:hypothetical protein